VYLGGIDEIKAALRAEDAAIRLAFAAADTILQNNINTEISARQQAVTNEATTRSNADAALQTNINTEVSARQQAVTNEATTRSNADVALQTAIDAEVSTRSSSDAILIKGFNTVKPIRNNNTIYISSAGTIEVDGRICTFNQSYTFYTDSLSSGMYRVKFTRNDSTVTPSLTTDTGSYSDSKDGYYSGNSRILPDTFQVGLIRYLSGEDLYELYLEAGCRYRVVLIGAGGGCGDGGDADYQSVGGTGGYLDYNFTANIDGLARLSSGSGGKGAWTGKLGVGGRSGHSYVAGSDATYSGTSGGQTPGGTTGRTQEFYRQIGGHGGVSGGYSGHGGAGGAWGHGGSGYNYPGYKGCGGGAASYLYLVNEDRLFAAGGGGGAGGDNAGKDSNDYPCGSGKNNINGSTSCGAVGGNQQDRDGKNGSATLYIL
jgi:hypothetical protein